MIIDDVKITVQAGKGGDGLVAFNKMRNAQGPTGGNGGNGGNVYFEGSANLTGLRQFRYKKNVKSNDGENGRPKLRDGANAKDLILYVPTGTVCHYLTEKGHPYKSIEINKISQKELIAKGGKGGKGNWFFRSSINTTPKQAQQGRPGEYFELHLELKTIADVGFIGLPNAGKSSMLNELTKAQAKVANYSFTTISPNLGVYNGLILADTPGIIEDASLGKGLGSQFLKHIERTKVLFHFISAESKDAIKDYITIRKELEAYGDIIVNKTEYIFLSKADTINEKTILKIKKSFLKLGKNILPISIIDISSIESIKEILNKILANKNSI